MGKKYLRLGEKYFETKIRYFQNGTKQAFFFKITYSRKVYSKHNKVI